VTTMDKRDLFYLSRVQHEVPLGSLFRRNILWNSIESGDRRRRRFRTRQCFFSWIESREDDNSLAATRTAWVLGFITAFNQYRSKPDGDVSGGKDTEVLMARIDDYCKWHPLDNLYNASAALVDELRQ
jgi:hypothetical protein